MALILTIIVTLNSAFALDTGADSRSPRAGYRCASLLERGSVLLGPDRAWLTFEVGRAYQRVARAVNHSIARGDLPREATVRLPSARSESAPGDRANGGAALRRLRRLISDLRWRGGARVAVAEMIVGADAIRARLDAEAARASELERAHAPGSGRRRWPGTDAPNLGPVRLSNVTAMLIYAGSQLGALTEGLIDGRYEFVGAVTLINVGLLSIGYYALFKPMLHAYRAARRPPTPDPELGVRMSAGADFIRNQIDAPARGRGVTSYEAYTLDLPCRTCDGGRSSRRPAPRAGHLIASIRAHGDLDPPTHARRLLIDRLFYFDDTLDEPVLINVVREPAYPEEGWL